MVYLRKIEEKAWKNKLADDSDSISDLGTSDHELSVWQLKEDLSDIDDIALALAMTRDNVNGIMVVLLDPEEIESLTNFKINIEAQPGLSLYEDKNRFHKNFMLYTLTDMGKLASYIHAQIDGKRGELFHYYDEGKLTKLLNKKFESGEFSEATVSGKGKWKKKYKEYKEELQKDKDPQKTKKKS